MSFFRSAALRVVSLSATVAPVARNARPTPNAFAISGRYALTPATSTNLFAFRRNYATEQEKSEEQAKEQAQDTVESAVNTVKDTASRYADKASSAVRQGIDSVASDMRPRGEGRPQRGERGEGRSQRGERGEGRPQRREGGSMHPDAAPSKSLYIGNLYFEVNEDKLRQEFGRFGDLKNVKLIFDARGLSKGFGYVEFAEQDAADNALRKLNNQVFEGRRLAVQYAVKRAGDRRDNESSGPKHPPSKTLFVGNMSYEMTDTDLNDLFKDIKNVLDVRVAIDRRTGNPRGFAHADFTDVPSAEAALEYLKTKVFYGRTLKLDYSSGNSGVRARDPKNDE